MIYSKKFVWKVISYVHTEPSIDEYKLRIMNLEGRTFQCILETVNCIIHPSREGKGGGWGRGR